MQDASTICFCINASTLITEKIANSSKRKVIKLFQQTSDRIDISPLDPNAAIASSAPDIRNQITFPLIRDTRMVPNEAVLHSVHSAFLGERFVYRLSLAILFLLAKMYRYKSSIKTFQRLSTNVIPRWWYIPESKKSLRHHSLAGREHFTL